MRTVHPQGRAKLRLVFNCRLVMEACHFQAQCLPASSGAQFHSRPFHNKDHQLLRARWKEKMRQQIPKGRDETLGEVGAVCPTLRAFLKHPDATSRIPNGDVWSLDILRPTPTGMFPIAQGCGATLGCYTSDGPTLKGLSGVWTYRASLETPTGFLNPTVLTRSDFSLFLRLHGPLSCMITEGVLKVLS